MKNKILISNLLYTALKLTLGHKGGVGSDIIVKYVIYLKHLTSEVQKIKSLDRNNKIKLKFAELIWII